MNEAILLRFHKAGLQTLVQDQGRPGYQAFGVPVGGVMDREAAATANWLVGNPSSSPVLEITLTGPVIEFSGHCRMALCGADLSAQLDGRAVSRYQTIVVRPGDTLTFGRNRSGCRAYLAIGGQWQLRPWLGSCSAAPQNAQLLTPRAVINKGHTIRILPHADTPKRTSEPPALPSSSFRIRLLPGPEFDSFSGYQLAHFFSRQHRIHPDSNRMGYRLDYLLPDYQAPLELISSGVVPGTLQITHSGQPIILMADAQTTGGYCRLANVIAEDLDFLAQIKPGESVGMKMI